MVYVSMLLFQSVEKRESAKIKPALIIFCFLLSIKMLSVFVLPPMVISLLVNVYIVTVLYSMWRVFGEEEAKCNGTGAVITTNSNNNATTSTVTTTPTISIIQPETTHNFVPVHPMDQYSMNFASAPPRYEKV
jgi:hypothetical protein